MAISYLTSMTDPILLETLDREAVVRWQERAAGHVLGLGLLLATVIALPTAPTDLDRHQLPKELIVHAATWLAVLLIRPGMAALSRAARTAISLLLLATCASVLFAGNLWLALRAASLTMTGVAALLCAHYLAVRGRGPSLLRWASAAVLVGTASGLAQAYGVTSPLFASTRVPGGTFGNRNFLAHLAAIMLPVAALLVLTARRWILALPALLATAAFAGAVILTRSRAAWLAALAAAGVMLLALWVARRWGMILIARSRVIALGAALLLGPLLVLTIPNTLNWRSDSPYAETLTGIANAQEGSGRGRVLQYRNTLKMAIAHPLLGVGPGNWALRYGDVAPPNDPSWVWGDVIPLNPWPSSDWMALLAERGVFALAGALLLGLAMAWRGVARLRLVGEGALFGATLLGVLAAVAVVGVFDASLLLPLPVLSVAIIAGALGAAPGAEPVLQEPPAKWRLVLPLLLAVITARSAQQTAAYLVAGNGRQLSRVVWAARLDPTSYPLRIALATRLPCSAARAHARAALALAPDWPAARAAARRCGTR